MLLHFYARFLKASWKPYPPPETWEKVDDPIFRMYSRLKSCALRRVRGYDDPGSEMPLQRLGGKFAKAPDDMKEPERTERLLAHRFQLFRAHASDCAESMSLNLFVKVSGKSMLGLSFAWASMAIQVVIGVLSGIGPYLQAGGYPAVGQMLACALIKCVWAAVLICYMPCAW